jgi:hypothetical protein
MRTSLPNVPLLVINKDPYTEQSLSMAIESKNNEGAAFVVF